MPIDAKRELARLILETCRARDDSFDAASWRYRLSFHEAAGKVCADRQLAPLNAAMAAVGCREFFDWAECMLEPVVEAAARRAAS
jgi:hypothetical protein